MASRVDLLLYGMNYKPELTGVGRYSGELAEGLARRGVVVEVVTTAPHYPGWFTRAPYRAWRYTQETIAGVAIRRCPILLYKSGAGFWRLVAPLSFAVASAPVALWRILRGRPRVILCVEPTLFVAPIALLAAAVCGARTILHVQDLEVDAAFAVGHLAKAGLIERIAFTFERIVLRRFDVVVTISLEMAARLVAKGVKPKQLEIIRNWVDASRIHPLGRPSNYREELGIGEHDFVVLYSGQIGPKQAIHVVFEAAERLAKTCNIVFVVAGEGPIKAAMVETYGHLSNVRILGLQPEEMLNEFLNLADCHILPQDPSIKDLVLPSKLGGMLASGKPVLVVADDDSELAKFLGDTCIRLPTDRVQDLAELVASIVRDRPNPNDLATAGRLQLVETMTLELAMSQFLALLSADLEPRTSVTPAR